MPVTFGKPSEKEMVKKWGPKPKGWTPEARKASAISRQRKTGKLTAEWWEKKYGKNPHSKAAITAEGQLNLSAKEFKKRGFI